MYCISRSVQTHIKALLFHPGPQSVDIPGGDLHVGTASIFAGHFIRRIIVQYWGFWFLSLLRFLCSGCEVKDIDIRSILQYKVKLSEYFLKLRYVSW